VFPDDLLVRGLILWLHAWGSCGSPARVFQRLEKFQAPVMTTQSQLKGGRR
jgi:hypothetical protein